MPLSAIIWAAIKAIFSGEIQHWYAAHEAAKAIQEKKDDRNIQNDALNAAPGAADKWLHQHPKD